MPSNQGLSEKDQRRLQDLGQIGSAIMQTVPIGGLVTFTINHGKIQLLGQAPKQPGGDYITISRAKFKTHINLETRPTAQDKRPDNGGNSEIIR